MRIQCADAKRVQGPVHKMNMGGNVVVLDGDKNYVQNKETNKKTRTNYEQGQYVMCVWAPVREGEVAQETEKAPKGNRFAMLAAEGDVHKGFTRRAQVP